MGNDGHFWFNVVEAAVWFAIGSGFAVVAWRGSGGHRPLAAVTAVAFLAFGVSDLIELSTGAWYRPWPLLVLKAACVVTFVGCLLTYRRGAPGDPAREPDRSPS